MGFKGIIVSFSQRQFFINSKSQRRWVFFWYSHGNVRITQMCSTSECRGASSWPHGDNPSQCRGPPATPEAACLVAHCLAPSCGGLQQKVVLECWQRPRRLTFSTLLIILVGWWWTWAFFSPFSFLLFCFFSFFFCFSFFKSGKLFLSPLMLNNSLAD